MMILVFSAAFVGLVHSLAPGHWLPVVLMVKARKWDVRKAILAAIVAASGHILLSLLLGLLTIWIGVHFFSDYEAEIEKYSGLMLAAFGFIYAAYAYKRHAGCHGHTHHGPDPKKGKTPFLFLFSIGLTPCVAVIPVFATAAAESQWLVLLTQLSFSLGVIAALVGSTLVVLKGLVKLDHPFLEHHGDVVTGLGVTVMGLLLYFFPHS